MFGRSTRKQLLAAKARISELEAECRELRAAIEASPPARLSLETKDSRIVLQVILGEDARPVNISTLAPDPKAV